MWYSFLEQFSAISPFHFIESKISINFKEEEGILEINKGILSIIFKYMGN